ncbi:MAG: 50S ribosomal protein L9 [Clostridiales bacterium]|nr:50S ribosomal protein L9 [Clostridiales bacterium]
MKVILKEEVKGLGKKEDMVNVSDGYARNFLFPRGVAVEATKDNLNIMKTRKDAEKTKADRERAHAESYAEKISGINLVLKCKAGAHSQLFGSITGKDIADGLKSKFRLDVDKKKIALDEPIKTLGEHTVNIRLHQGVTAKLKVSVEAE